MKISIEIDCTPAEARQYFGLPNLEPLHEEMTELLKARMIRSLEFMDPETLIKTWFPVGAQSMEQFQKFMQRMMQQGGASARGGSGKGPAGSR